MLNTVDLTKFITGRKSRPQLQKVHSVFVSPKKW